MTELANANAETVQEETIAMLEQVLERARAFELPSPPAVLDGYRRRLLENRYNVLVAGELKRGKSTFINALIGRSILPTDVDVATSQVFRVSRADQEGYRLRFEDDSVQEITAQDLPRYGSQAVAEEGKAPRLNQIIRWIEVDVPLRFLPEGVSIVDTPGLGSVYAAHAEITYRFVPHADAVIFVLDSSGPIGEAEVNFVETLLDVTRNIFFIQTKIDAFRKREWEEVLERNQEILAKRFGNRLTSTRVWPISSDRLLKAAATGDDDYRLRSRHAEMAMALQAFLFQVSGWNRAAEAALAAEQYHTLARTSLTGRLAGLIEESKQKRAEAQQRAMQRKQAFDAEWGARGQKREELLASIRREIALGKQSFSQALQPKSAIFMKMEDRIDAVQTVEEANQLGERLAGELAAELSNEWRRVREGVENRCNELLAPFVEAANTVTYAGDANEPPLVERFQQVRNDFLSTLGQARVELLTITSLSGLGFSALAAVGIPLISAFPVLPVAVGVFALGLGLKGAKDRQVKQGKQELLRLLNDVRQQLHPYYFAVSLETGRFSIVDEFFNALERSTVEQVQETVKQKLAEAQAEIVRLGEADKLDDQQRRARAQEIQQQLAEWDSIKSAIQSIQSSLRALDQLPSSPAVATATAGRSVATGTRCG